MKSSLSTVITDYFKGFLSLIFPDQCVICAASCSSNQYICFSCAADLHYTHFEKFDDPTYADELFWGRVPIEHVYSLLYFREENSTQKIIHHIKYKNGQGLGIYMGQEIAKRLENTHFISSIDAIIPIPLHSKKAFIRGYNQSLLIAKGIHFSTQIPIVELLYRKTHDVSQTHKSKEERYQNVKGKFAAFPQKLKNCKHLAIVDDVLTTGATLEFAARAIIAEYPSVKISIITVAIAH